MISGVEARPLLDAVGLALALSKVLWLTTAIQKIRRKVKSSAIEKSTYLVGNRHYIAGFC